MTTKLLEKKRIPGLLYVYMDRVNGPQHVGELVIDDDAPGGFAAKFRYAKSWLTTGFPIDPINLPLQSGWVYTSSKYISLGVLFDAGPDMWGRRVIQNSQREGASDNDVAQSEGRLLVLGRGNGVGALLFAATPQLTRGDLPGLLTLPTIEHDLQRVHEAAHNVFSNDPLPEHLQGLLAGSWSIGGARAKAVMRTENGEIWIAKFSEPGDRFDRQRCELANIRMASDIGISVAASRVVDTALGSVFLIKRFDRSSDLQRLHYASAISLISAEPEDKRLTSALDRATFSYARIADVISKVSPQPQKDRMELFARMVFNICVRNTDDHLKNTGFVEAESRGSGSQLNMRLSPLFDVVTQPSNQHFLQIGKNGRVGSIENALSDIGRFRLTEKGARDIAERVIGVVARREDYYRDVGLKQVDIDRLNVLIEPRCSAVSSDSGGLQTEQDVVRVDVIPGDSPSA